jgi:endonuclease III related protein
MRAITRSGTGQKLLEMFDILLRHYGPRNWWPAETQLEVMIGAVLTQNTNWKNVEKAITNLKEKKWLTFTKLRSISLPELAWEIRPAGYYNIKAKRLKNMLDFISERYPGGLGSFLGQEPQVLREALLSINGIGPETADSIVLYAANQPVFVVDAYTHRILNRHGMVEDQSGYQDLQNLFMDNLPSDPSLFNEFHALIVETGKNFCRKKPRCDQCPLEEWNLSGV